MPRMSPVATPLITSNALQLLQEGVEEALAETVSLQQTDTVVFRLGACKSSVWQLLHKLKAGLQSLPGGVLGAYLDFTATHLVLAVMDAEQVWLHIL